MSITKCSLSIINQSNQIIFTFFIHRNNDPYYTIIYHALNEQKNDSKKSAMIKLVEKSKKISVSYNRIVAIRDKAISGEDGTCHYSGCACGGNYKHSDPDILAGHALAANILVVCVGCGTGFNHLDDFKQHLKPECYLEC